MKLAATTFAPTNPVTSFAKASEHYNTALSALEFPPTAMVDIRSAIGMALEHTTSAITLLEPHAITGDMFTSRNAAASIESAKTGAAALRNAAATLEDSAHGSPFIPIDTFLTMARNTIRQAETALWWE